MFDFLSRLFGRDPAEAGKASKEAAKERLRLVLVHDRAACSPELLATLKVELIAAISKYLDIDEANLVVNFDRSGDSVALVASIPVRRVNRSLQPASH